MIELRPYQQDLHTKTLEALSIKDKICVVAPTGSGKSVLIAKLASELKGRTLILTHRIEILKQNSEWLKGASVLTASHNGLRYDSNIVIAMVQTLFARIKKYGIEYIGEIDNIILDEVQVLIFEKVFKQYNFKKLVGFTATPTLNKKKYSTVDNIEFIEDYTLSEIFDDIVQGVGEQDLIDLGYLTQDYNVVLDLPDFNKLKESDSSPDGYTKKSLNEVYSNTVSLDVLTKAYNKYCIGKKTLIFNASTKINKVVYKHLKELGVNVKMFDSVNDTEINPDTSKPYTRDEIIDWFRNEHDAVLINTNVFTTGFDVTDIEVIIVNRATKSLALWLQMVGRGSRITDKILKDFFTVIDLGQNIYEHSRWSEKRNWKDYFYSKGKRRKHITDLLDTWECANCGSLNLKGDIKCEYCGAEKVVKESKDTRKQKDGQLTEIEEMPLPRAKSILNYTINKKENTNFAFQLLERKIISLFLHYSVSKDFYYKNKTRFDKRITDIYRPIYFAIIRSNIGGARKKLQTQLDRMNTKIDKLYK